MKSMKETVNIESVIIGKCLKGDARAQYTLYRNYSKAMYNIAIRLMGNRMDAEDVLQESFIKAFQSLEELKDPQAFGGWIKRIVINRCISLQRKKKYLFEEIEDNRMEDPEAEDDDPLADLDPGVVHHAIKELPLGARTIIVLRALEGLAHKEIAEMLNISVSTSKTQYHRALKLLKNSLKIKFDE